MRTVKIALVLFLIIAAALFLKYKNLPTLQTTVNSALAGTKGTYGVYVKNLKTQESYILNGDRVFEAGSLYKIWLMGAVFAKIKNNELKEDEILTQRIDVLNQKFGIAPEDAELTEGTISLTVKSALEQMIGISHNYAAFLLTEKVGNAGVPLKTTVGNTGLFFEKIYKGELVSKDYSRKMIEILKKQELNDGLPKYLPKEVQVAHKTGNIGWFKHDGGIVFAQNGDYIIVVMSESSSPIGAQERIASISKAVYDYF